MGQHVGSVDSFRSVDSVDSGGSARMELLRLAIREGLVEKDPSWKDALEEPLPAWVVLDIALKLLERVDPPSETYD
ncbi:hypothetical protein [Gorillibacterium sp. sgz500922]|uniref:hypothetical protein n=1 Tax=Gorillibacterium sp. sgz500922 TaxID=3446694 RepID=UPI003F67AC16